MFARTYSSSLLLKNTQQSTNKTCHAQGILKGEHQSIVLMHLGGRHVCTRTCLGRSHFAGRAWEAIIIANCNLGLRKTNRMHQKTDTVMDGSGGRGAYLRVLTGRTYVGKTFPGDGDSLTTPLSIRTNSYAYDSTVFRKNRGTADML